MDSQHSSPSNSSEDVPSYPIPKHYEFRHIMGAGCYGMVIECVNKKTEEHVAVKMDIAPQYHSLLREEIIMRSVMYNGLDNFNIVKCKGKFIIDSKLSLVYEMLDMSLMDYFLSLELIYFKMENIRTVIQQMAVALDALKSAGIIHTDVKLDNIMLVDQKNKPFRVKLIDFGLALFTYQAKVGHSCQAPGYRAPEIVLGLPFSVAIDVWSLGCVMAIMMFGVSLFPARSEYDLLRFMINLLGPPPQHLIEAGRKSHNFFTKKECGSWELKTPVEYWGTEKSLASRGYAFNSLDVSNMCVFMETDSAAEAERRECLELLKAMLKWDEKERITPSGILNHPFITKSFLNSSSQLTTCCNEPETSSSQAHTMSDESTSMVQSEAMEVLPADVIMVQPAPPENRIHLGDSSDEEDVFLTPVAGCSLNSDTSSIHEDPELPPVVFDDCVDHQDGENSQDRMFSESSEDNRKKEKKKKKNCFRRFFSWMKRTFCSCASTDCIME